MLEEISIRALRTMLAEALGEDEHSPRVNRVVARHDSRDEVARLLAFVSERASDVTITYYALFGGARVTQQSLASEYSVSASTIRQDISRALRAIWRYVAVEDAAWLYSQAADGPARATVAIEVLLDVDDRHGIAGRPLEVERLLTRLRNLHITTLGDLARLRLSELEGKVAIGPRDVESSGVANPVALITRLLAALDPPWQLAKEEPAE